MIRKLSCALPALAILLLAACGAADDSPAERAEKNYMPFIRAALEELDRRASPEATSYETFPFDHAYSYPGPTEEQEELYGRDDGYTDAGDEYLAAIGDLVAANLPRDASAYDQYRYIACFVSQCMDYDNAGKAGLASVTPRGAILGGKAVCLGYTNSFLYLCERCDLWCAPITGYASWNGEEHGWNMVKLADGTYYVDVTWCDQIGATIGSEGWESYFMLTEEALTADHGVWTGGPATGKTVFLLKPAA